MILLKGRCWQLEKEMNLWMKCDIGDASYNELTNYT